MKRALSLKSILARVPDLLLGLINRCGLQMFGHERRHSHSELFATLLREMNAVAADQTCLFVEVPAAALTLALRRVSACGFCIPAAG